MWTISVLKNDPPQVAEFVLHDPNTNKTVVVSTICHNPNVIGLRTACSELVEQAESDKE